jgi:hypothetical protein
MAEVQCKTCKATTSVDLKITVPAPSTNKVAALPNADFLMVTWTAAETGAMATVFGKGSYHFNGSDDTNLTQLVLPNLALPDQETCHAPLLSSHGERKKLSLPQGRQTGDRRDCPHFSRPI